jgi:hypothetical protein
MILELVLEAWIKAGLALYKANPVLVEQVFFDSSQVGMPTELADGRLTDTEKLWIPDFFAGGQVRYGGVLFPLTGNTSHDLSLLGDPSLADDPDQLGYQILPPAVPALMTLLTTQPFTVLTSWTQVPTQLPAFTIRLERDTEAQPYIGEIVNRYVLVQGTQATEVDINRSHMTARYLISIWTVNRLESLWLYAWLLNYSVASMQQFATMGLSDVSLEGSDLDPSLQFLPERVYVRHFLLTATRPERAANLLTLEPITDLQVHGELRYATIVTKEPLP